MLLADVQWHPSTGSEGNLPAQLLLVADIGKGHADRVEDVLRKLDSPLCAGFHAT